MSRSTSADTIRPANVPLAPVARTFTAQAFAAGAGSIPCWTDTLAMAIGHAGLGQVEALMGIIPGGGGTQYLSHRIGRNRALEIILSGDLYDAETAERYGWINRAVPAGELDAVVDRLARNIAALPAGVIAAAKRAIPPDDLGAGLLRENEGWAAQIFSPDAGRLLQGALAGGAQTRAGERDLEGLLRAVNAQGN
jgi:enoyl-CoA hydratase/carnithine racemase